MSLFVCVQVASSNGVVDGRGDATAGVAVESASDGVEFEKRVAPFLRNNCVECHSGKEPKGELDLSVLGSDASRRETWLDVRKRLLKGEMPPAERARPPKADVDAVLSWIGARFPAEPGVGVPRFPALRRLNRVQYANTIRDLFGVDFDPATFPSDDVGYGFDDIGEVLSMPDMLLEKYLVAAEKVSGEVVMLEDAEHPAAQRVEGAKLSSSKQSSAHGKLRVLFTNGATGFEGKFAREGEYVLRAKVFGQQAGADPCRAGLVVGKEEKGRFDVGAVASDPMVIEARFHAAGGTREVGVTFLNDYYDPKNADPKQRDRNLEIEWLELLGPVDPPQRSAFQREFLDGERKPLREVIGKVARRVWRRPVTGEEVDRLAKLAEGEKGYEAGLRVALEAMLVSPSFLFLVERDPEAASHAIGDVELATRLSYFLWSSTSDEELMRLAEANELHEAGVLRSQVTRMLRDGRSSALSTDFAAQWLQTRALEHAMPDPARFPEWNVQLAGAMRAETEMFFDAVLRENRSVDELLDSDFTYLNEALAKQYAIPGVRGEAMRRVHLDAGARGGVLGMGAVLTVTSNPTRTSPVKRGKWILENLLDAATPPPPPGVGVIDESAKAEGAASLRERLEAHRKNTDCAACHARLDPLGFGLENFDAIGGWRTSDEGHAIDARGDLPDGRVFDGPAGLKAMLKSDGAFTRCLTRKLWIYALGRGLTEGDEEELTRVVAGLGKSPTLQDVIQATVASDAFRTRRLERR